MWSVTLCFCISIILVTSSYPGPKYQPTRGEVWPKPQIEEKTSITYMISTINFITTNHNCDLLRKTIARYEAVFSEMEALRRRLGGAAAAEHVPRRNLDVPLLLDALYVNLTEPCEAYPYLHMDENYTLSVSECGELTSASIWGAMRGLETFAHLMYFTDDYQHIVMQGTNIVDYPRYPHRGLLIDTARHYLRVENILKTLDAMAINKMNVLHWHIVDDESFPYQSQRFPELSEKGAYHASLVYTKSDIEGIIDYATERGIRVLPEIDVPGHTASWGMAHIELLTTCGFKTLGPLNPIQNTTYIFLQNLFEEVLRWFPEKYFHVGGDEVNLDCWRRDEDIQKYMVKHHITNVIELHALFMENVMPIIPPDTNLVVWQEVFDTGVHLRNETLVQVWSNQPETVMEKVIKGGYNVLFSSFWYLDEYLNYTFRYLYKNDPRRMLYKITNDTSLVDHVWGGEACMWGEMVDDNNLMSTVWPRASAVAEVLWSPRDVTVPAPAPPYNRAEEHACRMIRRGIPAGPVAGPGFCVV